MDVSRIRALRGPNLWSRHTAIQAIVTCEGAECAIADLPGFEARLRDRFPVYLTYHDADLPEYLRQIEVGRQCGIQAYKFHSYKGGDADQAIFKAVRKEVGPDYALLNDPVCSYNLREAIAVGLLMEELNFVWLEEPFHEQKLHDYQALCRELTIPVSSSLSFPVYRYRDSLTSTPARTARHADVPNG